MKKTKTQKGITLIALIITIVVLLILAVVAINSIVNTDLIAHAENSTGTYNNSVKNEANVLGNYLAFLEEATRCEHSYGSDGKCTKCPAICPHDWSAWTVTTQVTYCTTTGVQGTNGEREKTCNQCGKTETEIITAHQYSWGNCVCGEGCPHDNYSHKAETLESDWGYDLVPVCNICGGYISELSETYTHNYENYVCIECGYECMHGTYMGGYPCFSDGKCDICGYECTTHNISKDDWNVCTICGKICIHEFEDCTDGTNCKECSKCKFKCDHTLVETVNTAWDYVSNEECVWTEWCPVCGQEVSKDTKEHNWDENNWCADCEEYKQ